MRKEPGHPSVLQVIVSSRSGHEAPPFSCSLTTSRDLILIPPLQVALQSPQAFQSPTSQSTKYSMSVKILMMKRWDEERTWASLSVAGHSLVQSGTSSSSVLWFFDDIPCSCFGSTTASRTAYTPWLPFANFAVNS